MCQALYAKVSNVTTNPFPFSLLKEYRYLNCCVLLRYFYYVAVRDICHCFVFFLFLTQPWRALRSSLLDDFSLYVLSGDLICPKGSNTLGILMTLQMIISPTSLLNSRLLYPIMY